MNSTKQARLTSSTLQHVLGVTSNRNHIFPDMSNAEQEDYEGVTWNAQLVLLQYHWLTQVGPSALVIFEQLQEIVSN